MNRKIFIIYIISVLSIFISIFFYKGKKDKTEIQETSILISTSIPIIQPLEEIEVRKHLVVTTYNCDASIVWNLADKYSPNEYATAAVIAMAWKETQFKSNAVCGWYITPNYDISDIFTQRIDKGLHDKSSRDDFIYSARQVHGGYGLAQWYSWDFLKEFYDYAAAWGTSISDADMQLSYIFWYIQKNNYYNLWDKLIKADSVASAAENIAIYYEGTKDINTIIINAEKFYQKYARENLKN